MWILLCSLSAEAQTPPAPLGEPAAGLSELRSFERQMLLRNPKLDTKITPTIWGGAVLQQVPGNRWEVLQDHQAIDSRRFAYLVGDQAQLESFEQSAERARKTKKGVSIGFLVGGLVSVGAGTTLTLERNPDNDAFGAGLTIMGGVMGLGMAGMIALMPLQLPTPDIDTLYSRSEADRWIDAHNDALRRYLGLTETQVAPLLLRP